MAYTMSMRKDPQHTFHIKAKHKDKALTALQQWIPHRPHAESLEAYIAFYTEWGFSVEEETGDITGIWLADEARDDEHSAQLFSVLAPFVESGSCIEMEDSENNHWQWIFDGEGVYYVGGRIAFDAIPIRLPRKEEGDA